MICVYITRAFHVNEMYMSFIWSSLISIHPYLVLTG